MKNHTLRKLKNKIFPKRGVSVRQWGECLKQINLKIIQEVDFD